MTMTMMMTKTITKPKILSTILLVVAFGLCAWTTLKVILPLTIRVTGQNENKIKKSTRGDIMMTTAIPPSMPAASLRTSTNTNTNTTSIRSSEQENPNSKPFLLSVPFYVYEELHWSDGMTGRKNQPVSQDTGLNSIKHSLDYWFQNASWDHPMRTYDPSKAKIFVVPILLNTWDERERMRTQDQEDFDLCWNDKCNEELFQHASQVLNASRWWQEQRPHVMVNSHWVSMIRSGVKMTGQTPQSRDFYGKTGEFFNITKKMHQISFEKIVPNDPNYLHLPAMYIGTPCESSSVDGSRRTNAAMIASLIKESFHLRRYICKWMEEESLNDPSFQMDVCGEGKMCPTLADAKFGFHVRGDTYSSQRLYDNILSGTVPLFTQKGQYNVEPSWIDWDKMSYLVDMDNINSFITNNTRQIKRIFKRHKKNNGTNPITLDTLTDSFLSSLHDIFEDTKGYEERYKVIMENRELFDWKKPYFFDMYMYILQANLYPETVDKTSSSSPWTIMKIPPPPLF